VSSSSRQFLVLVFTTTQKDPSQLFLGLKIMSCTSARLSIKALLLSEELLVL
jgi:hypothetical protein